MQRVKVSLLCLLSLSLAGVLAAQTAVDPSADVGTASLQDFSGGATLRGTYFDVRHMSGDGVGYKNGYSQIGVFTPYWLSEDAFIAPTARLLMTDNSDVGVNAGLVARRYDGGRDRIWGINGYYDSDVSQYGNRYNQLGVGFETLGQFFDFRANGYAPTGTDKTNIGPVGLSNVPFFFENRIGFLGTQLMEQALRGGDFEAGVPVTPQTPWLRAFAGGYAYQQDGGTDPVGVRGRLEAWVSDDLSLGVNVTWDKQFDTNVNFVADWRFAGFKPTRYFPQWTTQERMLMPVQRHWRVTAGHYTEQVNVLAFNPRDNQPYFVVWYDDSAAGLNNGTFENPYNTTLTHAIPAQTDLVLVRRGNTTEAAPLDGSIVLPDFARMLGEGKPHIFDAYGDFGPFHVAINDQVLPDAAFNDAANANRYPFLTSAGGDIITVGSHNEVSSFVLEGAAGRAVFGNNVAGFHLNNLEIANNIGGGIRLQNATGTGPVTLDGQTIDGGVITNINRNPLDAADWTLAGTGLGDNAAGGIFVNTGAAGLNLEVTNVAMNASQGAQVFGINLQADNGPLTTVFTNVQTDGIAPLFGNTMAGITLGETAQTLTATLNNVSASNNTGAGLGVSGTGNGSILVNITDTAPPSVFNGNGGPGIAYIQTGGTGTLNMTNIQANNNGLDGLTLFGSGATTVMNANVHNSFLTGNIRDGIHVDEILAATINLVVDPTDVRFNGNDGLFFNLAGASRLNVSSVNVAPNNSLFNNNNRSAIHGELNASRVDLVFTNTTENLSGSHGLFLDANAGSTANLNITNGTFANSDRLLANSDGVHIESDASIVNLTMTGTPANNTPLPPADTQRHGLFLDIQNASTFTGVVTTGNLTNSLVNGLNATFAGGSIANLTLDNTSLSNSGADGMNIALTGAATNATITLQNGSLNNSSGQDGLDFNVNDGHLTVNATASSFANSGAGGVTGNGILGVINNTGLVNLNFTNTPVTGSRNNGMFVTATGLSDIQGVFSNSSFNGNGLTTASPTELDGIRYVLDGSLGSLLTLSNGSTVNGNGGDGFELIANNLTTFTGNFQAPTSFSDNGQNAASLLRRGVSATVNNSTVGLTFATVNLVNNLPNATQETGFQFDVRNNGSLTAAFTGSNLSNNSSFAFDGNVQDVASVANVVLNSTAANNSGVFGALLNVTNGGTLNFSGLTGSSISNSAGNGVLVTVDSTLAASQANFLFDQMDLNSNGLVFGGDGFNGTAFGGAAPVIPGPGNLNAVFVNSSVSGNGNQGLDLTVSDNSVANFHVETSTINNNASEGLLADISTGGRLHYRSVGSSYNTNGVINGGFDGVNVTATGTGPADSATAILLFSGGTVDGNDGDGFSFDAQNGTTFTASLDGVSASNNTLGFGLNVLAAGANTEFNLLMSGANTFTGNGSGPISALNFNNINQAVVMLSGSFDANNGDGIHIEMSNLTNGVVAIGPGTTVNGSLDNGGVNPEDNGDGIDIRMTTVTNGSILIDRVASINNSAADGIHIEMTAVTAGAIQIQGPTDIDTSGDNGIDIKLTATALVNGLDALGLGLSTIEVLTLTNDLATPPGPVLLGTPVDLLPVPVTQNLGVDLGLVPAVAFTIDSVNVVNAVNTGILVNVDPSSIAANSGFITNNTVTGSGADGLNGDHGIHVILLDSTADGLLVQGNTIQTSTNDGLRFDITSTAVNLSSVDGLEISQNAIQTNSGHGLNIDLTNTDLADLAIRDNSSTGAVLTPGISSNGLDGIRISQNNSNLTDLVMDHNLIDLNGTSGAGHGVEFLVGSSIIPGSNSNITGTILSNNTITNNRGDGVRLVNPITDGAAIDLTFEDDTISNNTVGGVIRGAGIDVQLNNAEVANVTINSVVTGNNISTNSGGGVRLTTSNTASFNLIVGGTGAQNVMTTNVDAGIGILMQNTGAQGAVTSTFDLSNLAVTLTSNGADVNFNGEGLGVILQGSSVLANATVTNSQFDSNTAEGARFSVTGNDAGIFAELNFLTLGGPTAADGNSFSNSTGGDGIEFFRTADGEITNALIGFNTINGNAQNGLFIAASNANKADTYTIDNNAINTNGVDGVRFDIRADADIIANLDLNTITTNTNDGIRLVEETNAISDNRSLRGTWIRNIVTDNVRNGIELAGFTGDRFAPNTPLIIGDPALTDFSLANVISRNRQNGILVTGTGTLTIGNNVIQQNGTLANLGTANENAGVLMNVAPASTQSTITVKDNVITSNLGDGVQYAINSGFSGFTSTVAITDNVISSNSGRGIDLINRASNRTRADISRNIVNSNLLEGVYIVNTASSTQNQFSSSTTALLSDGIINAAPRLEVQFDDNQVRANGINSLLSSTGLVARVGTSSGGSNNVAFAGGFASNAAFAVNGADPFNKTSGFGGLTMTVTNSDFGGNFGNDILFHSFVSTVNPNTGTTWDQTTFNQTGYQSDPLSRFDLRFFNNTYDANSFDTVGTSLGGFAARNPALVAFYNTSDGVFKSRLGAPTIVAPNVPGPFNLANRARNATRQAARVASFDAPIAASGAAFLYPGLGLSTWRISADTADPAFIPGVNIDTSSALPPFVTGNARGSFLNGIGALGEQPFGWGQF